MALILGVLGGFALTLLLSIAANLWVTHLVRQPRQGPQEAMVPDPTAPV